MGITEGSHGADGQEPPSSRCVLLDCFWHQKVQTTKALIRRLCCPDCRSKIFGLMEKRKSKRGKAGEVHKKEDSSKKRTKKMHTTQTTNKNVRYLNACLSVETVLNSRI